MADKVFASELMKLSESRSVHVVTKQGSINIGVLKDGSPNIVSYPVGSFLLKDERQGIIAGPVDIGGALELAQAVATGHPRTMTDPQVLIVLATALLGFASCLPTTAVPVALEKAVS